jgi:pre-rRNA-processing protein TSR3
MKTVILRHKKENLKKCSLKGLEKNNNFIFYTYPKDKIIDLSNYFLLHMDGDQVSEKDQDKGIFLIDSTWKYLEKILKTVPENIERRSIPKNFKTAYPRKQTFCSDPDFGLASIEALYITYKLMNKDTKGILDNYYFKDEFLKINNLN